MGDNELDMVARHIAALYPLKRDESHVVVLGTGEVRYYYFYEREGRYRQRSMKVTTETADEWFYWFGWFNQLNW